MGSKFLAHLRRQWMGALALFLVLTGGVAYATHETILSSDIVDNQVFSADVRNDTLSSGGLAAADLRSGSVGTAEIATGAARTADIGDNEVRSADVRDDTLTGGGLTAADLQTSSVGTAEVQNESLGTDDLAIASVRGDELGGGAVPAQIDGPHVVATALDTITPKEITVPCPDPADNVTGGGFVISGPGGANVPNVAIQRSYAVDQNTWLVRAVATSGTPQWQLTGSAICAF